MATEGSGASRASGDGIHNEDTFLVDESLALYAVCDGESGAPAGEVAARVAAQALGDFVARAAVDYDLTQERVAADFVAKAMSAATEAVADAEAGDPALRGLATTVTMVLAVGGRGIFGHRGDSRAYLIRRGRVRQLTVDHDATEAIASREAATGEFDVFAVSLERGDTLVLCTDGAEEVVEDDALARAAGGLAPHLLASRIVSAANRSAPARDATAVVVRVRSAAPLPSEQPEPRDRLERLRERGPR